MGHIGEGENDFSGLDRLDLSPEALEEVKGARLLARDIINSLEPQHLEGYVSLLTRLEDAVQRTKTEINIREGLKNLRKD